MTFPNTASEFFSEGDVSFESVEDSQERETEFYSLDSNSLNTSPGQQPLPINEQVILEVTEPEETEYHASGRKISPFASPCHPLQDTSPEQTNQ
jgi:hypothetical protein